MARWIPCDDSYICPFIGPDTTTGMCGLGVDDEGDDYEPDDSNLEVGYDPYSGCYTDDC